MQKEISNNNGYELRKVILRTIAFYDLFDFPLSPYEIFVNLGILAKLEEVLAALEDPGLDSLLGKSNGLYFFSGRESICQIRQERYIVTHRKYKTALRAAKLFSRLPWIEMISIGNIIGPNNAKDKSDIDFFIITRSGKIWLARFFCSLAAKMLGWRPHGENTRDKVCLSFFVAEDAMDLQPLMLASAGGDTGAKDDPYFIYWLANLTVIYARPGIIDKFVKANAWIENILPNWPGPAWGYSRTVRFQPCWQSLGQIIDFCLAPFGPVLKRIQQKIMPSAIQDLANRDKRVVVTDSILKLHVNDRREEIRDAFRRKFNKVMLKMND